MDLVEYWSQCSLDKEPYIHPEDAKYYSQLKKYNFTDDLIPVPYVGDIRNAKIIIAMINPGLQTGENCEYEFESKPVMQKALRENLYQSMDSNDYPFMYLNPELEFHPGYKYWISRFKKSIEIYAQKYSCDFKNAQKVFAKNIAILELVPYHSEVYRGAVHSVLPSSHKAIQAFQLLSKIRLVVIPRKHKDWGFAKPAPGVVNKEGNVICYFNRKAVFGEKVRNLIIEQLG